MLKSEGERAYLGVASKCISWAKKKKKKNT